MKKGRSNPVRVIIARLSPDINTRCRGDLLTLNKDHCGKCHWGLYFSTASSARQNILRFREYTNGRDLHIFTFFNKTTQAYENFISPQMFAMNQQDVA